MGLWTGLWLSQENGAGVRTSETGAAALRHGPVSHLLRTGVRSWLTAEVENQGEEPATRLVWSERQDAGPAVKPVSRWPCPHRAETTKEQYRKLLASYGVPLTTAAGGPHSIVLEKRLPVEQNITYPVCTDGLDNVMY